MLEKLIAFFMSVISFFMSLFGINVTVDYSSFKNVAYGNETRQVLDLYIPDNNDGELGLVLMIHGGAWIGGDKSTYTDTAKNIADNYGCAAATINYRYLSEDVNMYDILDDITAATAKIKAIGNENGVNINKMLLTGMSAGGHLSMLYAYSKADVSAIEPVAVVNFCGPTNLADENFLSSDIGTEGIYTLCSWATGTEITADNFSDSKAALLAVSPIAYINTAVPTVIAHGEKDATVPYSNALTLVAALETAGVKYDFVSYPNSGHSLSDDSDCSDKTYELFAQYIEAYLK